MGVKIANNAVSTIIGAISSSDTGVAVVTGSGALFPPLSGGDYFYATLVSAGGTREIVRVTARAGDAMVIARAQEGTTAQSFAAGSRFELRVTAASITDMVAEYDQASEIGFTPTGGIAATNVQSAIAELDGEAAKLADLASTAAGKGSALVGYIAPRTGATAQTVNAALNTVLRVTDFGAVGDGVTNTTAAITAAVAAAVAAGADLFWPLGTYLTTASIPSLHSVRHRGQGIIQRGSDFFHVEPSVADNNTLYVSSAGSTTNDGLSTSQPLTVQSALTTLANYGPILAGKWNIVLAAGTYLGSNTVPIGLSAIYPVVITGPDVGGHPNTPTAILDGNNTSQIGIRNRGRLPLYIKNIKFQNWTGGSGVASVGGTLLATDNVHGDNNYDTILSYSGILFVGGGVYELKTGGYSAIKSMFGNTHSVGSRYDIDTGIGSYPSFRGYITGTTLTVTTAPAYGQLVVGKQVFGRDSGGTDVVAGTTITALGTGTGGVGTYTVSVSQTFASSGTPAVMTANGIGPQISGYGTLGAPVARGVFAQENATGHVESVAYNNLIKGIEVVSSSRAHFADSDFAKCATAVEAQEGCNVFDGGGNVFNAGTANANTRSYAFYAGAVETAKYGTSLGTYIVAASSLTGASITGTPGLTETALYTYPSFLSGHEFTDWGVIRVRLAGLLTGVGGNKIIYLRLGTFPGLLAASITFAAANAGKFFAELSLVGTGINTQHSYGLATTDGNSSNTAGIAESANVARNLVLDDGVARDLTISAILANSGDTITLDYVEVHRGGM